MKIFTLLLIISTAGCSMVGPWEVNIPMSFDTYQEAWAWVADNIEFDEFAHPYDWPHPEKVFAEGKGDCQGYTMLFAYFLHEMGHNPIIIVYEPYWTHTLHVVVYLKGVGYIEPQIYGFYDDVYRYSIVKTYTFDQIMYKAKR